MQFAGQWVLKTCQSHTLPCFADTTVAAGGCLPTYSQEGQAQIMMDFMSVLLRVNLMLTPNQSLLNTQHTLNKYTEGRNFNDCYMDSPHNLSVRDYTTILCMVYEGNVLSLQHKMKLDQIMTRSYFHLL